MNTAIREFLTNQKCASICCIDGEGAPYCFSCFYAFNSEDGVLYFKSSADTYHCKLINTNPRISGTVLPDKLPVLALKGVQFQGEVLTADHPLSKSAAKKYYRINPLAIAIPGEVWTVMINHIKMTDSSQGFGKKIAWTRNEMAVE
jgi:uncharacterized protein YhbP (UPF0306 family)